MSTTSDTERYGTKSCLSVDMIEGLFTAFALRRFEKDSEACLLRTPSSSNKPDHSSSERCDRRGDKDEPSRCYGSISSRQAGFPPGDALLSRETIDCPAIRHQICMIYDTDSDGVASRVADSTQIGALQPLSTNHRRSQWCPPMD